MTDVPSKHVWKIKETCYVYTTKYDWQIRQPKLKFCNLLVEITTECFLITFWAKIGIGRKDKENEVKIKELARSIQQAREPTNLL